MAGPYNLDPSDPGDTAITAQFPANERLFRTAVSGYLNTEHDYNTGYHMFQLLTTSNITGLTTPPTGMLVYNTTLGVGQVNTGTSGTPVWVNIAGVPASLTQVVYTALTAYTALAADSGVLFSSLSAGGAFTLTLPVPANISPGWLCGVVVEGGNAVTVIPNATGGAHILLPTNQSVTTLSPNNSAYEMIVFKFDGVNFRVTEMTLQTALDNTITTTQGAILYRGSARWTTLAPTTVATAPSQGPFLATGGASANPLWTTVTPTFSALYISSTLSAPAAAHGISAAHGLGAKPNGVRVVLICTTANNGYNVGDEFAVETIGPNVSVSADATYVYFGVNSYSVDITSKSGGLINLNISIGDWGVVIRAWL